MKISFQLIYTRVNTRLLHVSTRFWSTRKKSHQRFRGTSWSVCLFVWVTPLGKVNNVVFVGVRRGPKEMPKTSTHDTLCSLPRVGSSFVVRNRHGWPEIVWPTRTHLCTGITTVFPSHAFAPDFSIIFSGQWHSLISSRVFKKNLQRMHWRCGFLEVHDIHSRDLLRWFHTPQSRKTHCLKNRPNRHRKRLELFKTDF